MRCEGCGSEFQPRSNRHRFCSADCRSKKQRVGAEYGPNRAALEEQIEAMATGQEHRALIEACRSLAGLVDVRGFDDKAWREYRLALSALQEACSDVGDVSLESLTEELRAQIPDTEDTQPAD